jgi:heat shock protein HslJ
MSRSIFRTAGLFVTMAALTACAGDGMTDRLEGPAWRLRSIQRPDGAVVALPSAVFTAEFGADGRIGVRADCNSCGGGYEAADGHLQVSPLACTRVFCQSSPVDTDSALTLEAGRSYDVDDHILTIHGDRGTLTFER